MNSKQVKRFVLGGIALTTLWLLPQSSGFAEPLEVKTLTFQQADTGQQADAGEVLVQAVRHYSFGYRNVYGGHFGRRHFVHSYGFRPRYYGFGVGVGYWPRYNYAYRPWSPYRYNSYRPWYGYSGYQQRYSGYSAHRSYVSAFYVPTYTYRPATVYHDGVGPTYYYGSSGYGSAYCY